VRLLRLVLKCRGKLWQGRRSAKKQNYATWQCKPGWIGWEEPRQPQLLEEGKLESLLQNEEKGMCLRALWAPKILLLLTMSMSYLVHIALEKRT